MTTAFPIGLDALTNPSSAGGDTLATVPHDAQHANANDAVEALEAKVGIDGSAVTTSIDYLLNHLAPGATASWPSDITPAQITADQDNYAPTGHATATVFRLDSNASRNITGIQGGFDGRLLVLVNKGTNPIVLKDASTSSSAANRFSMGADLTLASFQSCLLLYDSTASRWRLLGAATSSGGGGGAVATDLIWNTKGDLVGATGADAAAIIAVGAFTNGGIVVTDSTVSTGWKVASLSAQVAALGPDFLHNEIHGPTSHTDTVRSRTLAAQEFNVVTAAFGSIGTVPDYIRTVEFADAATQYARTSFQVPDDWISGLSVTLLWAPVGPGGGAEAVRWTIQYKALADGSLVGAAGTAVTFTGTSAVRSAGELEIEPAQAIATGVAAGSVVRLVIARVGADAADTLTGIASLVGVRLDWTAAD